ncbi:MAG: FliM/FliN family flagellar motor switch protein [Pseudomonadota bacterium]
MNQSIDTIIQRKVRGPKMRISGFPAMEPLCNAFASHAATMARKQLRNGIDVSVYGYEVVRHGDYLRQLFAPSAIYILQFPGTGGSSLTKAHPRLLGKVLDLSLGGDGSFEHSGAGRELTSIDHAIYGRFVDMVSAAFHEAILELCGRSALGLANKVRFEEQPGMVRIAADRAEVFVIKLNFHIAEDKRGAGLDYVIPVGGLEPLKRDLASNVQSGDPTQHQWARHMYDKVLDLPVPLEGTLPLGQFSVGELSRLEQGMLIDLPANAIDEVQLRLATAEGKVSIGTARLGVKGRTKALRLVDDPDPDFVRPLLEMERP